MPGERRNDSLPLLPNASATATALSVNAVAVAASVIFGVIMFTPTLFCVSMLFGLRLSPTGSHN